MFRGDSESEMTCRCRRRRPNSSPPPALEDDDLLAEILLRLPPQPSSLPRASLTCKRWRRLIRDPGFLRRFRAHHRSRGTAPVLGFFTKEDSGISFHPTLDPPNRVPPEPFRLQITGSLLNCRIVCCRDGLALLVNVHPGKVLVWDPVTGDRRSLLLPQVFRNMDKFYSGMVLRSAAAVGDVDPFQFQVVLVRCIKGPHARAIACVYSSDTRAWGDLVQISTPLLRTLSVARSGALVGRSLYWSLYGNSSNAILEFDLDRQNLAVIPLHMEGWIMSAEGGGLGLVSVSGQRAQLWKRETDSDSVTTWCLTKTIHLNNLLPTISWDRLIVDFMDESNMLIMGTLDGIGIFTVHTESMQCKQLPVEFKILPRVFKPFASVYTAEMGVGAEHAGAELLHNR
nr:putative F-box protein At3g16210 isoform X2 [Lolium perenne]XP_051195180.1 putative F-box protein At3g16210 isoform X2 [Lolium perenne]